MRLRPDRRTLGRYPTNRYYPPVGVQRKIRNGVQVQGQDQWAPTGGEIRADSEAGGQAECGAGGGDYEFIAASPHYTIVRGIRISENDVRRPGTVRMISPTVSGQYPI